jgi:hypothetical protein
LRSEFYVAFEAANIYLQFRRPLADTLLADDGPAWLRQTLGWICYAQRRLPHVKRGAVVYISLRDRLPCDPAYLPPPELPFDLALAWVVRGGEPEPDDDDGNDNNVVALKVVPDEMLQKVVPRVQGWVGTGPDLQAERSDGTNHCPSMGFLAMLSDGVCPSCALC